MKCFNRFTILAQAALFFAKLGYHRVKIDELFEYGKIASEVLNESWFRGFDMWDVLDSIETYPYFFNYKDDEFYIATCEYNIYKMEEHFSYGLPKSVLNLFWTINMKYYNSLDRKNIKSVYGPQEDGLLLTFDTNHDCVCVFDNPKLMYKKRDSQDFIP